MVFWRTAVYLLLAANLQSQVFTNGGFESGLNGWRFWSRTEKAGALELSNEAPHGGSQCGLVRHTGGQDWALEPVLRLPVAPGELYEVQVWAWIEAEGEATLCASTWDASDKNIDWSHGERRISGTTGWQLLKTRLFIPPGVASLQPRLIGSGPFVARFDDFEIRKAEGRAWSSRALPQSLAISNQALAVTLNTSNASWSVHDRRTGRVWRQKALSPGMSVLDAEGSGRAIKLKLFHAPTGLELAASLELEPTAPELRCELKGEGELPTSMRYPHPFESVSGDHLVIPMNEGISFPVDDQSVPLHQLIAYGGHGLCMAFWGVTDGRTGHMALIETPDDAGIQMARTDGRMVIAPYWEAQRGQFGQVRKLRYVFLDHGGHVAIAKRYRAYAQATGLFKTLAQKRQEIPNVDLLIGAVNVWCWDKDAVSLVREMQSAGIERILWSNAQPPENLKALNDRGVLTSRYDIYQDVMNPADFPRLRYTHKDWPTAAWPNDLIPDPRGRWIKGWGIETRDSDSMIYCGVVCDERALGYARERVPAELATHPYRCRFIDTTTASPWRECYSTNHPMTRTQSKHWKMELLRYMSAERNLVTGSETGHDAAVPFVHYFEGMMSLGPFRVPDAGRRMSLIYTNVPEVVAKYQVGHQYRLPLWELVFHDCVVAQWYWGDYNNKLPAIWDKRDLFNVLYGTPPMFMFDRKLWKENQERFVRSYKNTCPHIRQSGYSQMTDHRFLTPDRNVQQTAFASGQVVTVNFGAEPFHTPSGETIGPLACKVTGPR